MSQMLHFVYYIMFYMLLQEGRGMKSNKINIYKLILLRKKSNLTQQELADKLGVRRETIVRLEKGETQPQEKLFKAICDVYNIKPEYLLSDFKDVFTLSYLDSDGSVMAESRRDNINSILKVDSLNKEEKDEYETFLHYALNSFANICEIKKREIQHSMSDKDLNTAFSELDNIFTKLKHKKSMKGTINE